MRLLGIFLIIAAVIVPIPYFIELIPNHDVEALFSQYLGSVALILMAISQLVSTRFPGVQLIFGGLDRVYLLHKWIGIFSVSAFMLHDVIDAEIRNLGRETWIMDMAEEGGEIALYGLLILVLISLLTFVPYELWKKTHKFIGAFYALAAFHYLYIIKPFTLLDPLGIYLTVFCAIGVVSYVYMLIFHGLIDRAHSYLIKDISVEGDILDVRLSPVGRGIKHTAGQFSFFHWNGEKHPFTIASGPTQDRNIRFCIKALGGHTSRLKAELREGDQVLVSRPFGHFKLPKTKQQCWIAGGIGITPFLAWIDALGESSNIKVDLFYCIRSVGGKVSFIDELKHPNVHLHVIDSATGDRLEIDQIKQVVGEDFKKSEFSFCGPKSMRHNLQEDISLNFEEFELRSGTQVKFLMALLYWGYGKFNTVKKAS